MKKSVVFSSLIGNLIEVDEGSDSPIHIHHALMEGIGFISTHLPRVDLMGGIV